MRKSYIIAIVFTLLLVVWMLSGVLSSSEQASQEALPSDSPTEHFKVSVERLVAEPKLLFVSANGQVEPNRVVQVRAQTQGQLDAILAQEGGMIEQGEPIARIAMDDRQLILDEQLALLESRERTLERLEQLAKQNYQSASELDRAKADFSASQAAIARVRLDITRTSIIAPFSGMLEKVLLEEGDFVQVNAPVAVLLEQSPLLVTVNIAQQEINRIALGNKAQLRLSTGEQVEGFVNYISPRANSQTRTFEVEIEIDNQDGKLRSGMSAGAQIETDTVDAHFISPALFSLGTDGDIGVKAVDAQDTVRFYPVSILQSNAQGAWVSGLPQTVDVIVSGQGFVSQGSQVDVARANDA